MVRVWLLVLVAGPSVWFQAGPLMLVSALSSLSTTKLQQPQPQPQPQHRPIQKVAIVGAGISGLSVAHCLVNSPQLVKEYNGGRNFQVSVYDARPCLDTRAGAGVQLNGGLAVLGKINAQVQKAVLAAGLPQTRVQSRAKAWDSDSTTATTNTSNNPPLFDTLLELDLPLAVSKRGGELAKSLLLDTEKNDTTASTTTASTTTTTNEPKKLLWIAIMRGALQQALFDTLPDPSILEFGKQLIGIHPSNNQKKTKNDDDDDDDNDEGGAMLQFSDGSSAGPFDLVIGCDGIRSACREYIETGKISADPRQREGSSAGVYSGIRIKYVVQDGKAAAVQEQAKTATLTQYFGNGAYALDGTYGAGQGQPNSKSAFLIYLDDNYIGPFQKKKKKKGQESDKNTAGKVNENADWTQDVEKSLESEKQAIRNAVEAAGLFTTFGIGPIIESADRIFSLGVYFHNPFSLVGWSKKVAGSRSGSGSGRGASVVLVGDAAHALPPFLGQGANQAIQDAYCLATRLYQYNQVAFENDQERLGTVVLLQGYLKDYERVRWRPTFDIFLKSAFLGYLETGGPNGVYAKFRDVFFKSMARIGVAELVLFGAALPKV